MDWNTKDILSELDKCCDCYTFPMLDNGYVYLAATRLSLYRSPEDWAMVIEVFGFSPRSRMPDTHIHTFASRLHGRKTAADYESAEAYEDSLAIDPHNESRFIFPIEAGEWRDEENSEIVVASANTVRVRDRQLALPSLSDYAKFGIDLIEPPGVCTFELCRALAEIARNDVLATAEERRGNVLPEMQQILQLEDWHHPDVVYENVRPSGNETFQQLAEMLVSGNVSVYRPTLKANTHWKNWPDGGTL